MIIVLCTFILFSKALKCVSSNVSKQAATGVIRMIRSLLLFVRDPPFHFIHRYFTTYVK